MPYIIPERRKYYEAAVKELEKVFRKLKNNSTPGDLAYLIWFCIKLYLRYTGRFFANYAEVLGILESLKHLLYEQEISPYEKEKREENGDV